MTTSLSPDDLSTFAFGLETPSKYLDVTNAANQWSVNLTPSFFGREQSPSGTSGLEANPFEYSFDGRKDHSMEWFDGFQHPTGLTPLAGRKRALSSPACTPGGLGAFLGSHTAFMDEANKRPKMKMEASNESISDLSSRSGTAMTDRSMSNVDEFSPVSSDVLTPSDSSILPLSLSTAKTTKPQDDFSLVNHSDLFANFTAGAKEEEQISEDLSVGVHPSAFKTKSSSALNSTISLGHVTQPTYSQFNFEPLLPTTTPTMTTNSTATPFTAHNLNDHLRSYTQSRNHPTQGAPAKADASSTTDSQTSSTVVGGKKGKVAPLSKAAAAKAKKGKKASTVTTAKKAVSVHEEEEDVEDAEEKEEAIDEEDEEARRKMFLERNRIAACKSRQKKKERVGNLEQQAREIASRNSALQSVAMALHEEVRELRHLLNDHDGCSCQHILGYLSREANGGGIPTIDALAGRTLVLDYSNVPTMGSEDDLYAPLLAAIRKDDNSVETASVSSNKNSHSAPKSKFPMLPDVNAIPIGRPGPCIPLKRSTLAQASQQSTTIAGSSRQVRRNSAPPTSPYWMPQPNEVQGGGYFDIKIEA